MNYGVMNYRAIEKRRRLYINLTASYANKDMYKITFTSDANS